MLKDLWEKFDKKAFWEAIKLALRELIFIAVGFIVDFLVVYFSGVQTKVGYIVWLALNGIDKYLHEQRASENKKPLEGWSRGLLPF